VRLVASLSALLVAGGLYLVLSAPPQEPTPVVVVRQP
jgi:hypothetical protein